MMEMRMALRMLRSLESASSVFDGVPRLPTNTRQIFIGSRSRAATHYQIYLAYFGYNLACCSLSSASPPSSSIISQGVLVTAPTTPSWTGIALASLVQTHCRQS